MLSTSGNVGETRGYGLQEARPCWQAPRGPDPLRIVLPPVEFAGNRRIPHQIRQSIICRCGPVIAHRPFAIVTSLVPSDSGIRSLNCDEAASLKLLSLEPTILAHDGHTSRNSAPFQARARAALLRHYCMPLAFSTLSCPVHRQRSLRIVCHLAMFREDGGGSSCYRALCRPECSLCFIPHRNCPFSTRLFPHRCCDDLRSNWPGTTSGVPLWFRPSQPLWPHGHYEVYRQAVSVAHTDSPGLHTSLRRRHIPSSIATSFSTSTLPRELRAFPHSSGIPR